MKGVIFMVDLSRIGRNLGAENVAGAYGGQEKVEEKKKKQQPTSKGLGLNDIPTTPKPSYLEPEDEIDEIENVEADTILDKIDQELEELQENVKNVLAKKIKLADKHSEDREKQHRLLASAYQDCKNAYVKINEVRKELG